MAQLIQQELQRWGFNLRMKNEFEKFKLFRVNNFVKDGRGVLQVQEMLSLRIQLVRGVVVDEDGNKTDPAEFALATGVEGNGEVKDDELPIEVKPKLSYVHGGWKKKFVIVRPNKSSEGKSALLELYVEKHAHHKPVISVLLEKVDSITRLPSKTRDYAFEVKRGEKNLLCVGSESEIETFEWMETFHQHLLEPRKELEKLPEIEDDYCKVSVIPNKDSERLNLKGHYYAVVREMRVRLYDPYTGEVKMEWNMHHLKKVLVSSKVHYRDKDRIMHFFVSSRSDHGKAELHFFSLKARRLADAIFEVLSGNIQVTSRQTRSASMVFEISAKDLKKMMKDKDPDSQSLASVAMDTNREEERSVQTIPEEMGALAEEKGDVKEAEGAKVENGHAEHKEESTEQSNGHVVDASPESANSESKEGAPQESTEEKVDTDKGVEKEDTAEEMSKEDTNDTASKEDSEQNGTETGAENDTKTDAENCENVESVNKARKDNDVPDDQVKDTSEQSVEAPAENGEKSPGAEVEKDKVEEKEEEHQERNGHDESVEDHKDQEKTAEENVNENEDQEQAADETTSQETTDQETTAAEVTSPETTDEASPTVANGELDKSDNVEENGETAQGEDPASDSTTAKENQTLPHDVSTDSGFINDAAGDNQNSTAVSINTNNNNSQESLTSDGNGDGDPCQDNTSNGSDSSKNSEKMQPDVLPVVGMAVDVADLEEISVIVYSEDSPEVLV